MCVYRRRGYQYMKDALKDAKKLKAAYEEVRHTPDHLRTWQSHEACWLV